MCRNRGHLQNIRREFGQNIADSIIGGIVHEDNQPRSSIDQLTQRRPIGERQRLTGRVCVRISPGRLKCGRKVRARQAIAIGDEQRDHLAGVGLEKGDNGLEPGLQAAAVLLGTSGVAQLDGGAVQMALRLQEAHTDGKLVGDTVELIVDGEDADKSGIVAADKGDVGVELVAQLRVAVAHGGGSGGAGQDGKGRDGPEEAHHCG